MKAETEGLQINSNLKIHGDKKEEILKLTNCEPYETYEEHHNENYKIVRKLISMVMSTS